MDRVGFYLAYLYLMRVPILAWIILVVFPVASVPTGAPLGSLLRGIFDLSSESPYLTALSLGMVAFFGLLSGVAIGVPARLILLDGEVRFGAGPIPRDPGIKWLCRVIPLSAPLPLIACCAWETYSAPNTHWLSGLLGGVGLVLGIAAFFFVMGPIHNALWRLVIERPDERAADVLPPNFLLDRLASLATLALSIAKRVVKLSPAGYVKPPTEELWNRHSFAVIQFVISLSLYLIVFVSKMGTAADLSTPTFPTLCLLLILFMLICLTLSALSFFLDRYRIPLLTLVILLAALSAILPQGDHFYYSRNLAEESQIADATPATVCANRNDLPMVVVAASGGGIQSSAWSAIVLSGLKQSMQERGTDFDCSVRVISSVSGSSVGAMYFLDAYQSDGTLPTVPTELTDYPVVKRAESSSLDAVAWGLAYQDVFWSIFPYFKGVSFEPPAILQGATLTADRGTALEDAWRISDSLKQGANTATLCRWRQDAARRRRPAVIFNSTLVESGKRLLISTTKVGSVSLKGEDSKIGRELFDRLYPGRDLDVVTAARLSATFPYVTPAARIWQKDVFAKADHVADGGYYDNYGIVSLLDWLDPLRSSASPPKKVIVVQIRGFPTNVQKAPDSERGWFFQAAEPITTLAAVRTTGQFSHNQVDMIYVQRKEAFPFPVTTISFEFPAADESGKSYDPPLSWHLTPAEKQRLREAWLDKRTQAAVQQFKTEFDK